jgi:hypothetical protein
MYTPTVTSDFVLSGVGGSALGAKGLAGLALTYPWSTGRATMMVLMVVHHRFLWWPFHPGRLH